MDLASGNRVPQEILHHIVDLLEDDLRTIRNLCLASHGFCLEAQKLLYRKISIVNCLVYRSSRDPQMVDVDRATLFLTTISYHNSDLGHHVCEFHFSPENHSLSRSFWDLVNRSLFYMDNLKIFALQSFIPPSPRELFWGTMCQLEEFYWDDGGADPKGETVRFLRTQPELKVLAASLPDASIHSTIFPELQTFIGDTRSIMQVLPHHPIANLRWKGRTPTEACRAVFPNLKTLRMLSIGAQRDTPWLDMVAPYMKSLEFLHITGSHDVREIEYEFNHLSRLVNLRVFIWSPWKERVVLYTRKEQIPLTSNWFRTMKKLETVYFSAGRGDFLRWNRSERDPVLLTARELVNTGLHKDFVPLFEAVASTPLALMYH